MAVAPLNHVPTRPVVTRDDQTVTTLLKKLIQSQKQLQTKVAKLEAQAMPPRTTAAPVTRPPFRQGQPHGAVHEPGANWTPTAKLAALAAAASTTWAFSAAKAVWEMDRSGRCGVRSTSGQFTGRWPVHWGIGGHGRLLYAPTTRHFFANWQIVLIDTGCWRLPQLCEVSPAHLWTSEGRPKSKSK